MLIYDVGDKCRKIMAIQNWIFFIVEQILAFALCPTSSEKCKICFQISNKLGDNVFTQLNVLIWIARSILSLNSKRFHEKLYSKSLYIVDIICHLLGIDNFIFHISWKPFINSKRRLTSSSVKYEFLLFFVLYLCWKLLSGNTNNWLKMLLYILLYTNNYFQSKFE